MSAAAPVLLSLDTATERLHLAFSSATGLHVRDLPGGAQASATLLPALTALLREAGLAWADVDAIAFGNGPGAFTGLRTACSVAQGLALALNVPVIALDTLMAVAEDARQAQPDALAPGETLWVLQDARMDELYVSAFQWDGHGWRGTEPARLWSLDEPARRWAAQDEQGFVMRWAGNAGAAYPQALAAILPFQMAGPRPTCIDSDANADADADADADAAPTVTASGAGAGIISPHAAPRGPALAALAIDAWNRGLTLDAALALPRYVRDKVAQTTAERAADKAVVKPADSVVSHAAKDVAEDAANGTPDGVAEKTRSA